MDGSPDGSIDQMVMMDPSSMLVGIGKLGIKENGMGAQIYSGNLMKTLLILWKCPYHSAGTFIHWCKPCLITTFHTLLSFAPVKYQFKQS